MADKRGGGPLFQRLHYEIMGVAQVFQCHEQIARLKGPCVNRHALCLPVRRALPARRLHGFATLDLRLEYALTRDWTLQAQIGNALDRDYETAAYYNQDGRNLALRLRYAPVPR